MSSEQLPVDCSETTETHLNHPSADGSSSEDTLRSFVDKAITCFKEFKSISITKLFTTFGSQRQEASTDNLENSGSRIDRPNGLANLGNTCYFNSTVQALCHTRSFYEELENINTSTEVVQNLKCLFQVMLNKNSEACSPGLSEKSLFSDWFKAADPKGFHSIFCQKVPRFGNRNQHDAHEFLRHLLDEVRKEERMSQPIEEKKTDKSRILTSVDKVFGGHLLTVYICETCQTPYHIFEPCLDISLPICIKELNDNWKINNDENFVAASGEDGNDQKLYDGEKQDERENCIEQEQSDYRPHRMNNRTVIYERHKVSEDTSALMGRKSNEHEITSSERGKPRNEVTSGIDTGDNRDADIGVIYTRKHANEKLASDNERLHNTSFVEQTNLRDVGEDNNETTEAALGVDTNSNEDGQVRLLETNSCTESIVKTTLKGKEKIQVTLDLKEYELFTKYADLRDMENKVDVLEQEGGMESDKLERCEKTIDEQEEETQIFDMNTEEKEHEHKTSCDGELIPSSVSQTSEGTDKSRYKETQLGQSKSTKGLENRNCSSMDEYTSMVEDDNEKDNSGKTIEGTEMTVCGQERKEQVDNKLGINELVESEKVRTEENENNNDTQVISDSGDDRAGERKLNPREDAGGKRLAEDESSTKDEEDVDDDGAGKEKNECADKTMMEEQNGGKAIFAEEISTTNTEEKKYADLMIENGKKKNDIVEIDETKEPEYEEEKEGQKQELIAERQNNRIEKHGIECNTQGDTYMHAVSDIMKPLYVPAKIKLNFCIEHCLEFYTRKEHISGDYLCSSCQDNTQPITLTSASKQTLIFDPPAVLVLHLKRFKLEERRFTKITDKVKYGELLDIGPFCSSRCVRNEKGDINIMYQLYAVVTHTGSLNSGHYKSYIRMQNENKERVIWTILCQNNYFDCGVPVERFIEMAQDNCRNESSKGNITPSGGTWFCCNDSDVRKVYTEEVLNQEAFLLFYERLSIGNPRVTSA